MNMVCLSILPPFIAQLGSKLFLINGPSSTSCVCIPEGLSPSLTTVDKIPAMSRVLRKHRALHISRITGGGNHCSSAIILHSTPLQVQLSGSLGSLSQVLDTSCYETYCNACLSFGGLRPRKLFPAEHEPLLILHNLSMLDCYRVTA